MNLQSRRKKYCLQFDVALIAHDCIDYASFSKNSSSELKLILEQDSKFISEIATSV